MTTKSYVITFTDENETLVKDAAEALHGWAGAYSPAFVTLTPIVDNPVPQDVAA